MIGWLLFAGWLIGFLLCWRTAAWILAHDLGGDNPDGFDIVVGGIVVGAIVSLAWPIVVPFRIAYVRGWLSTSSRGIHQGFMRPPRSEREKQLRREIAEREYQIAVLEQALEADGTLTKRSA